MNDDVRALARRLLDTGFDELSPREQRVISRIAQRAPVTRDINQIVEEGSTFGERAADAISAFGGSWAFIGLFGAVLVLWIGVNSVVLVGGPSALDPYPYIFLNLILSMLAALQAPVIMMAQNPQATKDRLAAGRLSAPAQHS